MQSIDVEECRVTVKWLSLPPAEVLREGDELLEVDGIPLTGRSTDEIVRLMV